ncbi:hypothetical protein HOLleu_08435 [Holothuria leucospilota]|uniref:Uncharacterized protein n=1 Tax=Holothuria leucospilota TaxID=206669 RepID=A0A9Q1CJ56_HOLLE|nr:hypothetical protein HOLleu_08435 [Holothuria leucospilota]
MIIGKTLNASTVLYLLCARDMEIYDVAVQPEEAKALDISYRTVETLYFTEEIRFRAFFSQPYGFRIYIRHIVL